MVLVVQLLQLMLYALAAWPSAARGLLRLIAEPFGFTSLWASPFNVEIATFKKCCEPSPVRDICVCVKYGSDQQKEGGAKPRKVEK